MLVSQRPCGAAPELRQGAAPVAAPSLLSKCQGWGEKVDGWDCWKVSRPWEGPRCQGVPQRTPHRQHVRSKTGT